VWGADVVFESAGRTETAQLSLRVVRREGTVVFFGVCPLGQTIAMEPNNVSVHKLTIVGSYVSPQTLVRPVNVLHQGRVKVDQFIIERFRLEAVHDALASLKNGRTIKSMMAPT
jgi:L-iditol 2-dehydrogenase